MMKCCYMSYKTLRFAILSVMSCSIPIHRGDTDLLLIFALVQCYVYFFILAFLVYCVFLPLRNLRDML